MASDQTVLVVDDHRHVRELLTRYLQAEGYAVLEAADGEDALVLSDQYPGPIHLLVADLAMPRLDGFTLGALAMQNRTELRVLYLTGYPESTRPLRFGLEECQAPILRKPFGHQDFLRTVGEALVLPQSAADVFSAVIGRPSVEAEPIAEYESPDGVPRATRYDVRLPLQYRRTSDQDWHGGMTQNMSRSGVLFRLAEELAEPGQPLSPNQPTDLQLRVEMPAVGPVSARQVLCDGGVARVVPPDDLWPQPGVAVSVRSYQLS